MPHSTIFGLFIPLENLLPVLVTTIVFVILGLIVFALAFLVITKAAPFSVRDWNRSVVSDTRSAVISECM